MDSIKSDLDLLENLSKKISDLVYNNKFSQISEINAQRNSIISKIKNSKSKKNQIRSKIKILLENNTTVINNMDKKLYLLKKNHNKFNKRLKAYSFNK